MVALFERDGEGLLVLRGDILDALHHVLAAAVAHGPALDRRDDVRRRHIRPVMPFEAGAKFEGPSHRAGVVIVAVDHLRFRVALAVDAEQRVVDHAAVIGGHVRRRPDRVVAGNVAVEHGANRARRRRPRLGHRQRRGRHGRHRGGRALENCASRNLGHLTLPVFVLMLRTLRVRRQVLRIQILRVRQIRSGPCFALNYSTSLS